jgi:hypothetical protein
MKLSVSWVGALATCAALFAAGARAQQGAGDVVYVPTPQEVVEKMLEIAKVGPQDFVIDLGSGDGRIVITAAKKFGARGFGVDLDRYLLKLANDNARREGVADRAQFFEQNLFETDLTRATVITTYLLPEMNLKLRPKLLALKPGTRIVAHDYDMENWRPDQEIVIPVPGKEVGDPGKSYVMLWIVPARVAGEWRARVGEGRTAAHYELSFEQEFQFVEGRARIEGHEAKIPEFKLVGDRLAFDLDASVGGRRLVHRFEGRVSEGAIEGRVTIVEGGAKRVLPWSAQLVERREMSDGSGWPPRQYRHLKQ